jgi:hypothetical protein
MNTQPPIFLLFIRRFLLLSIYAVFFVVQFFFNFKSDNNNIITYSGNPYATVQSSIQKHFVVAKDHHHKKPGFRLNKRFQPAIVPSIFTPCEEIPVVYLNKDKISKPDDYLLISFILAKSLRGPPAVKPTDA